MVRRKATIAFLPTAVWVKLVWSIPPARNSPASPIMPNPTDRRGCPEMHRAVDLSRRSFVKRLGAVAALPALSTLPRRGLAQEAAAGYANAIDWKLRRC